MAEIEVEKKNSGGKMWLWVIIILIAAGLAYWWFFANDEEGIEEVETEQVQDETVMKVDFQLTTGDSESQFS